MLPGYFCPSMTTLLPHQPFICYLNIALSYLRAFVLAIPMTFRTFCPLAGYMALSLSSFMSKLNSHFLDKAYLTILSKVGPFPVIFYYIT